jgi:hypothetical protein
MTREAPAGKGECDIRLKVDEAVEVSIHGDRVDVHNISGADARDDGSECSAPLPSRDFEDFRFSVKEKRGEIHLSEAPSMRNGYRASVFIRDSMPGEGRYWFRVVWKLPPPELPAGMSRNNAAHSEARGHGEAKLDDRAAVPLANVTVDYDQGGNVLVAFQGPRGRPVAFKGTLVSFDSSVMKADLAADESFDRLRGPMFLYFDDRRSVFKIEMHATDGQQRLNLKWEKGK